MKLTNMSQLIEEPRLFQSLCSTFYLGVGFELVGRNHGAHGIDGVSIADFEANLDEELSQLQQELSNLDLSTLAGTSSRNPQAGWQRGTSTWHPDGTRSCGTNDLKTAAGTDL